METEMKVLKSLFLQILFFTIKQNYRYRNNSSLLQLFRPITSTSKLLFICYV